MAGNLATAGMRITAAWLNTNIPGAWQQILPSGGWTDIGAGNAPFQCRLHDSVTVDVIGLLQAGTLTDGTTIGTLPAGMNPISSQQVAGVVNNPVSVHGQSFLVNVTSLGAMNINGVPAGTTQISVHFSISLDA